MIADRIAKMLAKGDGKEIVISTKEMMYSMNDLELVRNPSGIKFHF